MIYFFYVWCVILFLVMISKYIIEALIIWLNDSIYTWKHVISTTEFQTRNVGKLRYANCRTPAECRHTAATEVTEYQHWRNAGCRSRRCWPTPMLGQRRNASWVYIDTHVSTHICTSMQIYWLTINICRHWTGDLHPWRNYISFSFLVLNNNDCIVSIDIQVQKDI